MLSISARIAAPRRLLTSIALPLLATLALGACSSIPTPQFPGVYKIPISQGNIITQEMIDQLEPGMTPRQVIYVMGSPLVRDPYHQDRWDYVFNYQPGGGERGQERVTLYFEEERLTRLEGDFEPGPDSAWNQAVANRSSGATSRDAGAGNGSS